MGRAFGTFVLPGGGRLRGPVEASGSALSGPETKAWIARATEACLTIMSGELHSSQINEEQQALLLARAQGSLKRQDVAVALRSCYSDMALQSRSEASGIAALA